MATITQTGPIAITTATLNLSVLSPLPLTGHFTDSLVWNNGAGTSALIMGSGIVSTVSGTTLTDVTAGTFSTVEVFSGGQIFDISGFSAAAPQFFDLMVAQKWGQLAALVFAGDDNLTGTSLNDTLNGWGGNDFLQGGQGDDHLSGGAGNDSLLMNSGHDTLLGGAGADTFIFENVNPLSSSGIGYMPDFTLGVDKIELILGVFSDVGTAKGPLAAAHFHIGPAATTADQGIIYTKASGAIWADPDGTGPVAAFVFAHVPAGTALTYHDFFLG